MKPSAASRSWARPCSMLLNGHWEPIPFTLPPTAARTHLGAAAGHGGHEPGAAGVRRRRASTRSRNVRWWSWSPASPKKRVRRSRHAEVKGAPFAGEVRRENPARALAHLTGIGAITHSASRTMNPTEIAERLLSEAIGRGRAPAAARIDLPLAVSRGIHVPRRAGDRALSAATWASPTATHRRI